MFFVKSTCTWPRRDEGQEWPSVTASQVVGSCIATSAPIRDSGAYENDRMLITFNTHTPASTGQSASVLRY